MMNAEDIGKGSSNGVLSIAADNRRNLLSDIYPHSE